MRVEYDVIYSDRKTIGLTVERDNRIVVRAPHGTSEERVRKAVESKKLWLFAKSRHVRKYPDRPQQKEFVSGEVLLYLGRHYRLEIADTYVPGVTFHSKFTISRLNQARAQELCREWYERRARDGGRIQPGTGVQPPVPVGFLHAK